MSVSEIKELNDSDKDAILEIIMAEVYPRSAKDIRSKLRRTGRKYPEYLITRSLRTLLSEDKVRFKAGRWMSKELSEHIKSPKIGVPLNNIERPVLSNISEKVLDSVNGTANKVQQGPQKSSHSGPWGKFRNVITYYIECLRNEAGADAEGYVEDIGKKYVFIDGTGNWYPKTDSSWSYALPLGPHIEGFNRNLAKNPLDNKIVLGYPLEAIVLQNKKDGPDTRLIRPVFQYVLEYDYKNNAIILNTDDAQPEISLEWMKYSLPDYSEKYHFLSHCGLINQPRPSDEPAGFSAEDVRPDLDELVNRLASFRPKNIAEELRCRSVNADPLPSNFKTGIYNKAVIMIGKRTKFTQTLIKELETIKSQPDDVLSTTSLTYLFNKNIDEVKIDKTPHEAVVSDVMEFNNEQRVSISSLLKNNLSVVTGPPGTGKSQVVVGAVANARLRSKSVLFASRNHKAIDAVVNRLNKENNNPLIVRCNSKAEGTNTSFRDAIIKLQSEDLDLGVKKQYDRQLSKLDKLLLKRGENAVLLDEIQDLKDKLGYLEEELSYKKDELSEEVLIRLEENFDAESKRYLQIKANQVSDLKKLIEFIDSNKENKGFVNYLFKWFGALRLWRSSSKILSQIMSNSIISNYPPFRSKYLPENKDVRCIEDIASFFDWKYQLIPLEEKIKEYPPPLKLVHEVKDLSTEINSISKELLNLYNACHEGLPTDGPYRKNIKSLSTALKDINKNFERDTARQEEIQKRLREYIPIVLNSFPAWAVTNLSVGSKVPLAPAIFDLSVIDEASQCDIASAIPILYRAKRAAVVGDPNQLQHVSTLKASKDALLRKRSDLVELDDMLYSYVETSLYDLFAHTSGISPHLLRETYRSVDAIAQYSNNLFYSGMLRVATDTDKLNIPKGTKAGIHWTKVNGPVVSAGKSGCVSESEVDAVYDIVKNILVENNFKGTLGVVTPFRQQQKRLQDRIYDSDISMEKLNDAKFIVDTAHGFQGDEKDVMIFSLCANKDMPSGSLFFISNNSHLFNVAVSRARSVLHIVGNYDWALQSGVKHIVQLTMVNERAPAAENTGPWAPHESPWEEALYEALLKKGIKCKPQFPVAGRRLDLALVSKNLKIDIEVDSDRYHRNPDGSRKSDDTWRDIRLMGLGWKVMRFWVYNLRENMEKCVSEIEKAWSKHE